MTPDERALYEIAEKLEAAWNNADSAAWTSLFADDADFIHILGGFFRGNKDIERGHRVIFDTIYKGSRNSFRVEKVRFLGPDVAVVFLLTNLTWYLNGKEQSNQARPTLVAEKGPDGQWKIAVFQNTLVTPAAAPTPTVVDTIAQAHPQAHPMKGHAETM